jgi:hypothetical protein
MLRVSTRRPSSSVAWSSGSRDHHRQLSTELPSAKDEARRQPRYRWQALLLAAEGGAVLGGELRKGPGLASDQPGHLHTAAAAYLHERDGDPVTAVRLYAEAARSAPSLPERDHLTRQAARLNALLRS